MDSSGIQHISENQKIKVEALRSEVHKQPVVSGKSIAYIPIGHGSEDLTVEITVPAGCAIVVKGHAGETIKGLDFEENLLHLLDKKNRSILLNPSNKKRELFPLLTNRGNHTVAIYNEGDVVHDFHYSLLSYVDRRIEFSGILKVGYWTTFPSTLTKETIIDGLDEKVFSFTNSIYSLNTAVDISDYFSYSSIYPYHFTKRHIKDILSAITEIANSLETLRVDRREFNRKYANLEKDYDSADILDLYVFYLCIRLELPMDTTPDTVVLEKLRNCSVKTILEFISARTEITQSALFNDVISRKIQPGVFYNLVCRSTEHTLVNGSRRGLLEGEVIPDHISNLKEEVKENIIEAERLRKNQVRLMEPKIESENSKHFTLRVENVSSEDVKSYIDGIYGEIFNTKEYIKYKDVYDLKIKELNNFPKVKTAVYEEIKKRRADAYSDLEEARTKEDTLQNEFAIRRCERSLEKMEQILQKYFKDFVPTVRRVSTSKEVFETDNLKKYKANSNTANSYTYKKGKNGRWQRYKKGFFVNTKNVPKPVNEAQGVIATTQNNTNYVREKVQTKNGKWVNGKWKTRKWNNVAKRYVEENLYNIVYGNNATRKNPKWTEMAQKNKNMKNTKEMMGLANARVDPAGNLLGN